MMSFYVVLYKDPVHNMHAYFYQHHMHSLWSQQKAPNPYITPYNPRVKGLKRHFAFS